MAKNQVKCISIDTRSGFKDAEGRINSILNELGDTVDIKKIETVQTRTGKSNVIIWYTKKARLKE